MGGRSLFIAIQENTNARRHEVSRRKAIDFPFITSCVFATSCLRFFFFGAIYPGWGGLFFAFFRQKNRRCTNGYGARHDSAEPNLGGCIARGDRAATARDR